MKNIIILGSKGLIGNELYNFLRLENKIFVDKSIDINELLKLEFINKHKIDCIINCIGSTNKPELFFHSNFLFTSFLSEKLKEYDSNLNQELNFIHISSIGVNAPYMKHNFKDISINPFKKKKIRYNLYEFSKSCGEYNLNKNLKNSSNINTVVLQPSNIIFENSKFISKLKIFLWIFPFKIEESTTIPVTPVRFILKNVNQIVNSSFQNNFQILKLYKRVKVVDLLKYNFFISFLKIRIPLPLLKRLINYLPEIPLIYSLKRILIFIFIL